jgi:transposase-like protein
MAEHGRQFSPQFKAEAVQMVIETGKPIAAVARDLGVHDGTLANWVNAWRREDPEPGQPVTPVERVRVKELEDEVRRLRMENEFLTKAALDSGGQRNTTDGWGACGTDGAARHAGRDEGRALASLAGR